MPRTFIRPDEPGSFVNDDNLVFVARTGAAGLRRDFSVSTGEVAAEGEITLVNILFEALDELWTVVPQVPNLEEDLDGLYDAVVQDNGAVDFQLSVDEGSSFLFWDGAAWVSAGAGDWSTFRDLNLNLTSIPFEMKRQVLFRIRLRRGTNIKNSPLFCGLFVAYSLLADHTTEDPHRTISRLLSDNMDITFRIKYKVRSGSEGSTHNLNHPTAPTSILAAYNLTNDPNRDVNIAVGTFSGDVTNGFEIDLSSSTSVGDILEVDFVSTVPVILSHKDLDLNDEEFRHVPHCIVQVIGSEEDGESKFPEIFGDYAINFPDKSFKNEKKNVPIEYRVNIFATAADEILAIKIINAAYRTIRDIAAKDSIRMVMAGTKAEALNFTTPFANLTDTSEHLSVKQFTFILYVNEWFGEVLEGPLAETLQTELDLMDPC